MTGANRASGGEAADDTTATAPTGSLSAFLRDASAARVNAGLRAGEYTARELVEAALANIEAEDGAVHAFLERTDELAFAKAASIDQTIASGGEVGALAGVPVGFKDNMNQLSTHTTCASKMLENYVSPYEATCVTKMTDAGAIPMGKLNMDEFAFGSSTETSFFGPTHNPWDLERVPGGSSGGSAAAVASGMLTLALGSDTGGSIRQPASFCGVVGFKPTYGAVSRYGVVAFGSSLDQVGPFGRSVGDVATAMNALSGRDPLDCTSQECAVDFTENLHEGVHGMNIGIVPAFMEAEGVTAEVIEATRAAIDNLEKLGANIVEVDLPHAQAAMSAYYVLGPCEAFSNLARFDSVRYGYCAPGAESLGEQQEESRATGFGPEAVRRIMLGSYLLSSGVYEKYYYPAQQVRTLITRDYTQAFEKVSALVMPVSPRAAFKFGEIADPTSMYLSDMFTISLNIAGNGGMSLPVGPGRESGLPLGVQIVGPQFADANILQVGSALESCYDIARRAPGHGKAVSA